VTDDGAVGGSGYVIGTYMHGFFDDDGFRHVLVRALRAAVRLAPPAGRSTYTADRAARLDRLAAHVRRALDVRRIESWLA
jgi:adenosylcobyric acid synthase